MTCRIIGVEEESNTRSLSSDSTRNLPATTSCKAHPQAAQHILSQQTDTWATAMQCYCTTVFGTKLPVDAQAASAVLSARAERRWVQTHSPCSVARAEQLSASTAAALATCLEGDRIHA